ncbi:MAG: glutamine-hydrolyzing GMP synthase [Candidatus Omnitrophica bacterium]|nr:glutamine-hydrolyzing GMP synthase [Candidatus Omnitrophota bacterium]MCM8802114.1 glutamine-hydrolyzing GMP synthase [Candidatus Omnitrophota bacterium]
MVAIIDFGSQYTQLIARRVRELKVYCEIFHFTTRYEELKDKNVNVLILSGGPGHISKKELDFDERIFKSKEFYILGICYGMQLIAKYFGGKVSHGKIREYGKTIFYPDTNEEIFKSLKKETIVWMSHWDYVSKLPKEFKIIGKTENVKIGAFRDKNKKIYGVQFHPEVIHTEEGKKILKNFLFNICNLKSDWSFGSILKKIKNEIKEKVNNKKIICALSGGIDSSVLSLILNEVCGENSLSIFINNGLLRENEPEEIINFFKNKINFKYIDASNIFLERLKNIEDPEDKRKIIGNTFIEIFEKEGERFGAQYLAQGTLYPDLIESISPFKGPSVRIKTHHNVGGLPENMKFKLIEPFKFLFKDEIRKIAKELNLPDFIIKRHPFPGPGLAVRIIGKITEEQLEILRKADFIVEQEIKKAGLYNKIWQAFAVLLPIKSVGIMGDKRTYENVIAIRVVKSVDGMTADWVKIPYKILERISNRIINKVKGVNRVVYDITSKPPATIEWE